MPEVNAEVVPLPVASIPDEVTSTVPLNAHGLSLASTARIRILNGTPVVCVAIFPPPAASTRNLEKFPPSTVNDDDVGPEYTPSDTEIVVVSAFRNIVLSIVDETPLAKLTLVVYDGGVPPLDGPVNVKFFTPK